MKLNYGEDEFGNIARVDGYYIPVDGKNIPETMASWFVQADGLDQARFLTAVLNGTDEWGVDAITQWGCISIYPRVKEMLHDMAYHAQTEGENHG